ncbi:hypothetical protein EZ313_11935 [Ramlibacter henchirensis]|uniref:NHL repeat containing protein n=1 Tax=Ramlibacter henchirensis TaxID=204072 RepID=A0A4Z0CAX2_9BURK|nr:hypothetical protein [Ramlibacter henchirensis]TFZ07275.1 hypothetical protein EZ313_11935 [Ramlibacter henchirensis]
MLTTDLSVTAGTLRMGSSTGVSGDNSASVRIEGTVEQINAALNGMVYAAPSSPQGVTLQIRTQDASTPEPLLDSDEFTIAVVPAAPPAPVSSPPVHTLASGGATIVTGGSLTFRDGTGITVSDPDSTTVATFVHVNSGKVLMASGSGATITGNNSGFVLVNGTLAQVNAALDGMVYNAPTTAQTVVLQIESIDGGGLSDRDSFTITVRTGEFQTNQAASIAWGQPNFTTRDTGDPDEYNLRSPQGPLAIAGQLAYVPDTFQHRVLGFYSGAATGFAASIVIGQIDLRHDDLTASHQTNPYPSSVAIAGGRMAVVQHFPSRVSLWHSIPTLSTHYATAVLGQAEWDDSRLRCGASGLNQPLGVALSSNGSMVVVADTHNNRVNIYNFPQSGAFEPPLQTVLGQASPSQCDPNRNTGPSEFTLNRPTGVWTDGARLVVADTQNNRVLIWDTIPQPGASDAARGADRVLGQHDFESVQPNRGLDAPTRFALHGPKSVASDGTRLAVADTGNNRVLIWLNFASRSSGAGADIVLGQEDFVANDQNGGGAPTDRTLAEPEGVHFHEGKLYVTDRNNHRILIFEQQ